MTISKRLTIELHGQTEADVQHALEEALHCCRRGDVMGSRESATSRFRFEVDNLKAETCKGVAPEEVTLRVYLAAHAPAQVPDWFQPELSPLPTLLSMRTAVEQHPRYSELPRKDKERLREWLHNSDVELDDHLVNISQAAREAWKAGDEAHTKARRDREMERCVAWAWHWADQMIAASAAKPGA